MTYTGIPGDGNASPQQFVPAFGAGSNKYSKTFAVTLTVSGVLTSIQSNVFGHTSATAFKALSRVTKFITTPRV